MSRKQSLRVVCAAVLSGLSMVSTASAAAIYGGPAYDGATGTGYQAQFASFSPPAPAGSGIGVGQASKYVEGSNKGWVAVRWDTLGAAAELGNLGTDESGSTSIYVRVINEAGTVVGWANKYIANIDSGPRAVRWNASDTAATELVGLGADSAGYTASYATAINGTGTVVGTAMKYIAGNDEPLGTRAVRWDASGTVATELENLGTDDNGYTETSASVINDAGTVAGIANKYIAGSMKGDRAVRWDASGAVMELGNMGTDSSGYTLSRVNAINDAGTAVGRANKYVADGDGGVGIRAVRWDASGTAATELGNLGTESSGFTVGEAFDINDAGTSVGTIYKYEAGECKGWRAVRWDASGTVATELGHLGTDNSGWVDSWAYAINHAGMAVGFVDDYDSSGNFVNPRAVMWGPDVVAIELNTLIHPTSGWVNLTEAFTISDDNWITGMGSFDPDGAGPLPAYDRLFLLQASVPEPGTMALLAGGALMLLGRRRRLGQR